MSLPSEFVHGMEENKIATTGGTCKADGGSGALDVGEDARFDIGHGILRKSRGRAFGRIGAVADEDDDGGDREAAVEAVVLAEDVARKLARLPPGTGGLAGGGGEQCSL